METAPGVDKHGLARRSIVVMAAAWRARQRPQRRYGRLYGHSDAQEKNSGVSMNFDPNLTIQYSSFHMGT